MNRILSRLAAALRKRPGAALQTVIPWTHYTDFNAEGEYLIGIRRMAAGRQIGSKVELFRLPFEHDETDVRVKIQQAQRQAAQANESWSSST